MMLRLVGGTTPAHVTKCYKGLLDALVIDRADAPAEADVAVVVADTLIPDRGAARRLAETTLEVAMRCLAERRLERSDEVRLRHTCNLGERGNVELLAIAAIHRVASTQQ